VLSYSPSEIGKISENKDSYSLHCGGNMNFPEWRYVPEMKIAKVLDNLYTHPEKHSEVKLSIAGSEVSASSFHYPPNNTLSDIKTHGLPRRQVKRREFVTRVNGKHTSGIVLVHYDERLAISSFVKVPFDQIYY
jgi:hypothetical protein